MKGDFSRLTFDKKKHYSGVRMQQGRVQLDADWNEQLDITAHRIETEITDFIGASGAPATEPDGSSTCFRITKQPGTGNNYLAAGAGRYYVAGKLFENDKTYEVIEPEERSTEEMYTVYLNVWQQHVTALDKPAIREVALGGPDTATRIQNQWKVLVERDADYNKPEGQFEVRSTGKMKVTHDPGSTIPENQLYRVEIHKDGNEPIFKWDRDNGSVAAAAKCEPPDTLTLNAAPDVYTRFAQGQWVEVTPKAQSGRDEPGTLYQVTAVDGATLTAKALKGEGSLKDHGDRVIVRRWLGMSSMQYASDNKWNELEHGIQVQFEQNKTYHSGDYWLIPARVAGNTIEWPGGDYFQPPHGVEHAYVPLAKVVWGGNDWLEPEDLRTIFQPLATGLLSQEGDQKMTGKLAIGTPTESYPTHLLHIAGNNDTLRLEGTDEFGSGATLSFGDNTHAQLAYVREDEDDKLEIYGKNRVAVTTEESQGKIGIDTKAPTAKLEISGNLVASEDKETLVGLKVSPTFDDSEYGEVAHLGLHVDQSIHIERAREAQTVIRMYDFEDDEVGAPPRGFRVENDTGNPANNWEVVAGEAKSGKRCLRSGPIGQGGLGDNQTDFLYLENVAITGKGLIRFWWKTETEENYDKLKFEFSKPEGQSTVWERSGYNPWTEHTQELEEGIYNFKWQYTKDRSNSPGKDDVWIDKIEIKSEETPHISVGGLRTGLYSLPDNQLALVIDGKSHLRIDSFGVNANLIQEDWHEVVFNSGWDNFYTDEPPPNQYDHVGYFKDSQGIVHLKGLARIPPSVKLRNVRVFSLPTGYRPWRVLALPAMTQTGTVRLFIHNVSDPGINIVQGEVNVNMADEEHFIADNWISFDGITFRAAP